MHMFKYLTHKSFEILPIDCQAVTLKGTKKLIVSEITLKIVNCGITVIMGANGAGKSLFMRLLHGLVKPSSGAVCFNGRPIDREIRRKQAMVFQQPTLLRRSVFSNMLFVDSLDRKIERKRCENLLQLVGLADFHDQPARLLSGGEKQRLALARALVTRPELLLLDEPTANLDPASIEMIERLVLEANKNGAKIIFITHDLGQAKRLADDVIFLHRGALMEYSSAKTFFEAPISKEGAAYLEGKLLI